MMNLSYWDYVVPGVCIPALVVAATMFLAIIIIKQLASKHYSLKVVFLPVFFWGFGFAVFLTSIGAWFIPPLNLVLEPNAQPQKTIGTVEEIKSAPMLPIYYSSDSKSFRSAILLTVNGDDYYLPYCEIEVGTQVVLTWFTEQRVVSSLCTDADAETTTDLPVKPQTQLSGGTYKKPKSTLLGKHLARVSLVLFVGVVLLQYPLGHRVAPWLQKRDKVRKGGIVPNRIGILHLCILFLPFVGMLTGMAMNSFRGGFLILALGGIVFGWILIKKQTTSLTLADNKVLYRELRRELVFSVSDIQSVLWVQSNIPGNRRLRITLQNACVLDFEQENFWGLEDMYRSLLKRTQKYH